MTNTASHISYYLNYFWLSIIIAAILGGKFSSEDGEVNTMFVHTREISCEEAWKRLLIGLWHNSELWLGPFSPSSLTF